MSAAGSARRESLMTNRSSQRRGMQEKAELAPDSAHPVVSASPRAIMRGVDGTTTWVAQCPRCSDRDDQNIVAGKDGAVRAQCSMCGAVVELCESGIFRASPTARPPKR
jgi:hypothetical protein